MNDCIGEAGASLPEEENPMKKRVALSMVLLLAAGLAVAAEPEDPFLWLEEIDGERALAWVKEQNARTTAEFQAKPMYKHIYDRALKILDSRERIPFPSLYGTTVYNFWQDETNRRGLWRRTTLESYRTANPSWETVLDIDALMAAENVPWVFKGATCLPPAYRRCMVALSRGGGDAVEQREFDTATKSFVKDGFFLAEAKSRVAWKDENTLWVGTDFGPGSLTTSGYPRLVKLWARGTPLAEAQLVFAGEATDMAVGGYTMFKGDQRYDVVVRTPAFFRAEVFLLLGGRLVKLDVPPDVDMQGVFAEHLLFALRSDWTVGGATYKAGSLLAASLDDFLRGSRRFEVLFSPGPRSSLGQVTSTRDRVLVTTLDNVRGRMASFTRQDGAWVREEIALPGLGTVGITSTSDEADLYFYTYQDFLKPVTLFAGSGPRGESIKVMPAFFDATGVTVTQREATSKDGTRIPYFLIAPKGFVANGKAPTLLYAYGGFEVPQLPRYNASVGAAWLERGGVYVVANIRGGGEFGPSWHQAALKENRMKNFEDLIGVAEDLIATKVTSPRHLGIMGGSQGGLLVGATFTLRPDLFNAVVSQVPLADMRRYNKLLAGASWMAEYGNPDLPEEWAYIQTWSPYHLLKKDVKYPTPFYWTTTRDDRVHPAHARKMVAKMQALGHPVWYFENIEGGHGAGSVNPQRAQISALEYTYLWTMLK